jgi:glutamine synthetase
MADQISKFVDRLKADGITYVRFELPDMHGTSRLKIVPIDKVEGYARNGLNMYGGVLALDTASSVVGGARLNEEVRYSDSQLFPDLDSVTPVPWLDKTAKVICDPHMFGRPIAASPRLVLKQLIAKAAELGFDVVMGHEFEYYILTKDTHQPLFEGVHIFNSVRNQWIPEIDRMLDWLRAAGIDLITHNCEYSASQFETNFGPGRGVAGADKAFTFKNAVKEVVHRLGYHATFMSKPWSNRAGSGCHVHMSLIDRKTRKNAFLDKAQKHGLSGTCTAFIQGILDHAPAMMPLINPTPNCYHRLKPHTFAPSNISWGVEDRSAMVRVKASGDEATHIEMRAASAISNPYLTASAVLAAGLLGIKGKRKLQPAFEGPSEDNPKFTKFAPNLERALDDLAADKEMKKMLGDDLVHVFSTVKRNELARFRSHITDWERNEYMDVY